MSIGAFLVTAFIESFNPGPRTLACTFPPQSPEQSAISVEVEARPSLLDTGDRFRVFVQLGDERQIDGLAQPIDRTDDRDVLIRVQASEEMFYTLGLRDDGRAALNLLFLRPEREIERTETRQGACHDYQQVLDSWLQS